jgi:hypothetical protein
MAYFIPIDKQGWGAVYRLEREGHGRVVTERVSSNDPLTAVVSAGVTLLLRGLERLVARIVDLVFAAVKRWQEKREFERIKKGQAQYRSEFRKPKP